MRDAVAGAAELTRGRRLYALGLLMVVGLFNYIDRLCMSILQVPIKAELGLTDTQLGIMTGLAFAILYTTLTVPVARLADRTQRRYVIAGALVVWSLMTLGCGFAGSFLVMVILRMGVAIGESGCVPASHALLADLFPLEQRGRAIATWALVFPLGTMIGIASSGWLSEVIGWRHTFMLLGVTGLLIAPFVLLTLREPPRSAAGVASIGSLREGMRMLFRSPTYRWQNAGGALIAYPLNAALLWNAPFYSRVFGMSLGEMAVWLALLSGGAGAVGLFASGLVADRLGRRDARWYLRVPAITGIALAPFMWLQFFATDVRVSLGFGAIAVILLNGFVPPQAAATQSLVPANLRATAAATNVLMAGVVGVALGPFMTGVLSDALTPAFGADALRYAIGVAGLFGVAGGLCFLRASVTFRRELETGIGGARPDDGRETAGVQDSSGGRLF
jgi:MFS family permease